LGHGETQKADTAHLAVLGALEGSYFTSIIYSWAFWYSPAEMAPRVLLLYVANSSVRPLSRPDQIEN
jgi:hypothetical protein